MKTRTIVRTAAVAAAATGAAVATVGLAAGAANASTVSAPAYHGHHQSLTAMTGPRSNEAEIATVTHWQHAAPYALTDAGRAPALMQLKANSPQPGQVYASNQQFTELHNSSVTELAFGQRSHGGYEVLTQQGGRLVFEQLSRNGAAADQLWTWKAGPTADSWSFKNVGTGMYLTVVRNGGSGNGWFGSGRFANSEVGISSKPFVWQQVELPATA
jgi:hypothetical protein